MSTKTCMDRLQGAVQELLAEGKGEYQVLSALTQLAIQFMDDVTRKDPSRRTHGDFMQNRKFLDSM